MGRYWLSLIGSMFITLGVTGLVVGVRGTRGLRAPSTGVLVAGVVMLALEWLIVAATRPART